MSDLLFTPIKIGPITLRNRSIRAAAFEGMCKDNAPTKMLEDYHLSVAKGEIGMTTIAYASINRSGLSFTSQLLMREKIVDKLKEITDKIHNTGAKVSIQLGHCGNMSHKSIAGETPVSASTGFNLYSPTFVRGLRQSEIVDLAKDFGTAVNLARKAGFDAVEIHAGHGYLISQFLSPYTNKRKDKYGGCLENRMRFMRMVMQEVMKAAKDDIAVIVKTNIRDGFKGGIEIDEALLIAQELEKLGAHALVLSGGFVSRAPMYVMRGVMPLTTMTHYMKSWWLKIGVKLGGRFVIPGVPFKPLYFLEDALKFREVIKIPLIYVGGVVSKKDIDTVLSKGFECFAMARALVRTPDFIKQLKNKELITSGCKHSNYCIARMYSLEMKCHKCIDKLPNNITKEIQRIEAKG